MVGGRAWWEAYCVVILITFPSACGIAASCLSSAKLLGCAGAAEVVVIFMELVLGIA